MTEDLDTGPDVGQSHDRATEPPAHSTRRQPAQTPETEERERAWRRGEASALQRGDGSAVMPGPLQHRGIASPEVANRAFVELAENVREYAIFLLDPVGTITYWGEGARLIKWWTRDQAEGGHLRLLYPPAGAEDGTAEEHIAEAAERGEYTGEGHRVRSDGSTFWAGVTLTALRDAGGELLGFVKVTRDLTATRAAEIARRAALEVAEEATRLKGQFVATVSHEIRTPLTSIMAYTDLLKMELAGPLTPGHHRYLDTIRSSSQHLLGLIEDILDLSRAEAGRMMVGRGKVRVGDVVQQVLMLVDPQARRRRVEVVDALSNFAADGRCWGDEERVRQILLNLVGNAIKFTEPGGRIIVSAGTAADPPAEAAVDRDNAAWVFFRVEDTGPGIPPDRREAIFEPFVQVDMSSTRAQGGTGLGLAISRRLARLMAGDVTLRSEVGVGTTFMLWLPAHLEETSGGEPADGTHGSESAGILLDVREAILHDIERILHAYTARLRSDPGTRSARRVPEQELEDHLASFLADIAQSLGSMELGAGVRSDLIHDGSIIQRTIAERHGAQRARIGWTAQELRREFEILHEELDATVRRRVRRPQPAEIEAVIKTLGSFLEQAEIVAAAAHRQHSGG